VPAPQLGGIQHDPEVHGPVLTALDGDHGHGRAGPADNQSGTPVDALDSQFGPWQQGTKQPGDLICAVHGTDRSGHLATAVTYGDGVWIEGSLDCDDVAGVAGRGEPVYDVVMNVRHRPQ